MLPKQARKAIRALYRFARSADEIADDFNMPRDERKMLLQQLHATLKEGKVSEMPYFARDYYRACFDGKMNIKHGLGLIEAFIQDTEKSRYESWDDTLAYCRKSASTIGRMVLEATGNFSADIAASDKLCMILQLINHLQDLKKDYINLNRIYFSVNFFPNTHELDADSESESVTNGKREILLRLKNMLESTKPLIGSISGFRIRAEIATIYKVAQRLIEKLDKANILERRVELTKLEKIKCAISGSFWAFRLTGPKVGKPSKQLAMKSRSSFLRPLLKLDFDRRKTMLCFYSYCRLVDDAADDVLDKQAAAEKLKFWRAEVENIYSDDTLVFPSHPVTSELALYINKYGIEKEHLLEIINGQQMDVNDEMVKPALEKLELYCYRVASAVGLVSVQIFGYTKNRKEKIQRFAINLGKALQITNIIRDVRQDAGMGRIYIPQELLENYHLADITPHEIFTDYARLEIDLEPALKDLSEMAETYYRKASKALPRKERKNMRAAILMMRIYKKYLEKMEFRKFMFDRDEIKLSFKEKFQILYEPVRKI